MRGWQDLLELLFPPSPCCRLCGIPGRDLGRPLICRRCLARMEEERRPDHSCCCCGRLLEAEGLCPDCRHRPPPFTVARSLGVYDGLLKEAVQRLKFGGERPLAVSLGRLMARRVCREPLLTRARWIVPVPMHPQKLRQRNYNQAELLARSLGEEWGLPVVPLLERRINTASQGTLDREGRLANLHGVFRSHGAAGKDILLVDDVFTTGTTAGQCAEALLADGARSVGVITVATGRWR